MRDCIKLHGRHVGAIIHVFKTKFSSCTFSLDGVSHISVQPPDFTSERCHYQERNDEQQYELGLSISRSIIVELRATGATLCSELRSVVGSYPRLVPLSMAVYHTCFIRGQGCKW